MAKLATKKVGAEASWGVALPLHALFETVDVSS